MLFRLRQKAWCLEEHWSVSQEPRSRAWSCPAPLGTQWMLVTNRVHRRMTAIQHCLSLFGAVTSLLWPQFPCCKASWYRPQALYMLRFYCWMIQPSTALPGSTLSELRFDSSLWVGGPQFLFSVSRLGVMPQRSLVGTALPPCPQRRHPGGVRPSQHLCIPWRFLQPTSPCPT